MRGTLVGRERELGELLGSLSDPHVSVTLVVGDAGIGKTRLVAEAVAATPERLTLAGACLPMRDALPLLPVVDALDSRDPAVRRALARGTRMLPEALRSHLAGIMPRSMPTDNQPAGEVRRERLFLACEGLLSQVAEERPVTLVIEDVHWADGETLDLLTYLSGGRHSTALHLLVTCRADENRMPELVTDWLDAQRRSTSVRELHLGPLGADDVRHLVASLPRPDGADLDRLSSAVFRRAEGNPFFTEQLVASAVHGDRVPARLARLLSARVRAVSPAAQESITALAIISRPVPLDALRIVTCHDEETCIDAVRELEAASLIVRSAGALKPRHALLAEALLEELPAVPAAYHRRVATALESLDDPATAPEVADHLRAAGDEEAELGVAQQAAQRAWELGAYADAARWYQRVSELHSRLPDRALELTEVELVRRSIRALDLGGARVEATSLAERVWVEYAEWPDMGERLNLLSMCAHLVRVQERERGLRMLEGLLTQFETLPPSFDHAQVLSWIANSFSSRGDHQTAYGHLATALDLTRAAADLRGQAHVHARLAGVLRELGDRRAADAHAAEALRIAEETGNHDAVLDALVTESDNRLKYAEYDGALASAKRGLSVVAHHGLQRSFPALLFRLNAAEAQLALGHTAEVGRLVDELTDHPLRPDDDQLLGWARAHADFRRGKLADVTAWLEGRLGMPPMDGESSRMQAEALAYILLWGNRPEHAFQVAVQALMPLATTGNGSHAGLLFTLGARAAADIAQDGNLERAAEASAQLDDLLASMLRDPFADTDTLPRASVDRRQWQAERSRAEGRADPGEWQDAAVGWESLAMPHEAAYCWWRTAEALVQKGAPKDAVRDALQRAHRLAEEHVPLRQQIETLASRRRLPIVDRDATSETDLTRQRALTPQEVRVLRLLAEGLTNAEIGTALFISPKTASVHVTNLLRKLGMANRTEAAAWAARHIETADG
jgi:DNA-binding CsgD family transcriptional regulator/tetratricopeptide (TPR) repeat protein